MSLKYCVPKIHTELMKSSLLCTFNKLSMQSIDLIESEPVPEKICEVWPFWHTFKYGNTFFFLPRLFPTSGPPWFISKHETLLYPKCQQRFVGRPNLDSSFFYMSQAYFVARFVTIIHHYYTLSSSPFTFNNHKIFKPNLIKTYQSLFF